MAHRKFLVTYPDGSRKHIDREERDSLLYSQEIKEIAPKQYRYVAHVKRFHLTATQNTLQALSTVKTEPSVVRRYLGINVVFHLGDKRYREVEESAEGMAIRYQMKGFGGAASQPIPA